MIGELALSMYNSWCGRRRPDTPFVFSFQIIYIYIDELLNVGALTKSGILLYGPPGTGKTLIARKIGQMLNTAEPEIINGPEILSKYVGQAEENLRKKFEPAEQDQVGGGY